MAMACKSIDQASRPALREQRSPDCRLLASPDRCAQFVNTTHETIRRDSLRSRRNDYVNGIATSPVTFLERIYVHRRQGKPALAMIRQGD